MLILLCDARWYLSKNIATDASAGDNNDSRSVRASIEMEIYDFSHFH